MLGMVNLIMRDTLLRKTLFRNTLLRNIQLENTLVMVDLIDQVVIRSWRSRPAELFVSFTTFLAGRSNCQIVGRHYFYEETNDRRPSNEDAVLTTNFYDFLLF